MPLLADAARQMSWGMLRGMGAGFWVTDAVQAREVADKLAKAQYASSRNPDDCALLYCAMGKKSVLQVGAVLRLPELVLLEGVGIVAFQDVRVPNCSTGGRMGRCSPSSCTRATWDGGGMWCRDGDIRSSRIFVIIRLEESSAASCRPSDVLLQLLLQLLRLANARGVW